MGIEWSYFRLPLEEAGSKVRLIFVMSRFAVMRLMALGTSTYWSELLWIVDIFVECNKIDGIDVGTLVLAEVCICDIGKEGG